MDYVITEYHGIKCRVFTNYMTEDSEPMVMITSPEDLQKAHALGFTCIGYPNEVAKEITAEDYELLIRNKYIP